VFAVAAVKAAAGILLGGIITQYLGFGAGTSSSMSQLPYWSSFCLKPLPAHKSGRNTINNLDIPRFPITAALMLLVYGIVEALSSHGWNDRP